MEILLIIIAAMIYSAYTEYKGHKRYVKERIQTKRNKRAYLGASYPNNLKNKKHGIRNSGI